MAKAIVHGVHWKDIDVLPDKNILLPRWSVSCGGSSLSVSDDRVRLRDLGPIVPG